MTLPSIRTITFGLELDPLRPGDGVDRIKSFISLTKEKLERHGLRTRCIRVTTQALDWSAGEVTSNQFINHAKTLEEALDEDVWLCLPGPQFFNAAESTHALEMIPELLSETDRVFTNALIGSENGIHRAAIRKVATVIKQLASIDERKNANFRFAAIANINANTPFFPASFHHGETGFSMAMELAELMNMCFAGSADINQKLKCFEENAKELIYPVREFARDLAKASSTEFKGVDFSLAPYPGSDSSAVQAIERLNNTRFGDFDFLMSLYSVNNLLKTGFIDMPLRGYNGTMFSVLEDSHLAMHCASGRVEVKDLLLYANVCGCGLDMLPLPMNISERQLASLIESVAICANKWNKPLIARLLPCEVDELGKSRFKHDFIVNTTPINLNPDYFSDSQDDYSYYARPKSYAATYGQSESENEKILTLIT